MGEFEISYATRWNVLFLLLVLKSILHFTSHLLILQSKSIKSGWWGGWFTFVQLIVLTFSFCIYSLGKMSIRHFFFFLVEGVITLLICSYGIQGIKYIT